MYFADAPQPWTSEEQKVIRVMTLCTLYISRPCDIIIPDELYMYKFYIQLLEKALRTYPSSVSDRWDKIAELVKTRTKEECIARFKVVMAMYCFVSAVCHVWNFAGVGCESEGEKTANLINLCLFIAVLSPHSVSIHSVPVSNQWS